MTITQHDTFRKTFESLGFEVSVDYQDPDPDELPVLVAENGDGDEIYLSLALNQDKWILYPDLSGITLDGGEFGPHNVRTDETTVYFENVSGTRSKSFGYGVAGFSNATVEVDKYGSVVVERHG